MELRRLLWLGDAAGGRELVLARIGVFSFFFFVLSDSILNLGYMISDLGFSVFFLIQILVKVLIGTWDLGFSFMGNFN